MSIHAVQMFAGAGVIALIGGVALGASFPPVEDEVNGRNVVVLDASVDDPIVDPQICVQLSVQNLVGGSLATFRVTGGPPGELTAVRNFCPSPCMSNVVSQVVL